MTPKAFQNETEEKVNAAPNQARGGNLARRFGGGVRYICSRKAKDSRRQIVNGQLFDQPRPSS